MFNKRFAVWCGLFLAALTAVFAAGCGGGGGSSGGGGGGGGSTPEPTVNIATITVGPGPAGSSVVNEPYTSVKVCAPGSTTNCQTIDHMLIDTGSVGVRIIASALTVVLPQENDANNLPIGECAQFVGGSSWGPVKTADITVASETAASLPVQIIGDSNFPTVPSDCASTGTASNTVASFGANGILGVGVFEQDCGISCQNTIDNTYYYACMGTTCQFIALPVTEQVSNPIAAFAVDNNGSIIKLPSVPDTGAATATGSLVFGIGTRSNNGLGNAKVLRLDPDSGTFTTTFNGRALTNSFIDSGSNSIDFTDSSVPQCSGSSGFYCPNSTVNFSASNQSINGVTSTVHFSIANAATLLNATPTVYAVDNIGGTNPMPDSFDFGLPFFFGRNVYNAIENHTAPQSMTPYVAY